MEEKNQWPKIPVKSDLVILQQRNSCWLTNRSFGYFFHYINSTGNHFNFFLTIALASIWYTGQIWILMPWYSMIYIDAEGGRFISGCSWSSCLILCTNGPRPSRNKFDLHLLLGASVIKGSEAQKNWRKALSKKCKTLESNVKREGKKPLRCKKEDIPAVCPLQLRKCKMQHECMQMCANDMQIFIS